MEGFAPNTPTTSSVARQGGFAGEPDPVLVRDLDVPRKTASKYLADLAGIGLLEEHKIGKQNFYLNRYLLKRLPERHD